LYKKVAVILFFVSFFGSGLSFAEPGIRALSIGGAFVGLADDAEAVYWNPAGLGLLGRPEMDCSLLLYNRDETGYDDWFSFVYPLHRFQDFDLGVIGFSLVNDVDKGIIDYQSVLSLDSKFTERWYVFSYGRKVLLENLAFGANFRFATYESALDKLSVINGIDYPQGTSDSDNSLACDLGGYFRWDRLSLGFLLQNLNEPEITLYGSDITYDLNVKAGLTFHPDEQTNYSFEINNFFDANQIRLGGEYWIAPYLALRLGAYNLNKKDNRALTFGCGLNSAEIFAYTDIEIDYALLYWTNNSAGEDDFSHLVGIKMKF